MIEMGGPGVAGLMRFSVVINSKAGTSRRLGRTALATLFKDSLRGNLVSYRFVSPRGIRAACQAAVNDKPDALVILGGDGTARTAVEILAGAKIHLAALPGGTMNVMPKRLSGAMTVEDCVSALARGAFESTHVDCGMANDRPFLVGAAFGMVPEIARLREDFRVTKGIREAAKLSGRALRAMPRLMQPSVVCIRDKKEARFPALIASVERVDHWSTPKEAPTQSEPVFDCVALCAERWRQVAGILARAAWGGDWRAHSCIEDFTAAQLTVRSGIHTRLTLDGEPMRLPSPVRLRYAQARVPMIVFPEAFAEAKTHAPDRASVRSALSA